jgi:transcription-repair coupling factor (superfamily II helicase)
MAEIGFEMYHKILDEAIRELKRSEFRELFKEEISKQDDYVQDCTIDTDQEILIPDDYVESITERLSLYTRLDSCETEEDLMAFHAELKDRFGPVPREVEDLFDTVRCRKLAVELGFEKMVLKEGMVKCYFVNKPDSPYYDSRIFHAVMDYVQHHTRNARLKQTGRSFLMTVTEIADMAQMLRFVQLMHQQVMGQQKTHSD